MAEPTYKILLVDDDQFLLDMYSLKMRENGFAVEAFTHGDQVLEKLQEEGAQYDAVLMDIVMPGMDGFALLKGMQQLNLDPEPVKIVLSNQGQDGDIERAEQLGADGYIVKASAVPSEVVSRVAEILEKCARAKV